MARFSRWEVARWVLLGVAVIVLVAFLVAQRQSVDVSYGESPASDPMPDAAAATIPSAAELAELVDDAPVVRLPGAIATWDEQRVRAVIGDAEVRILVAPPGLGAEERSRLREVEQATVRVVGLRVSGGGFEAVPSSLSDWRTHFASGDITDALVALIARLLDQPDPAETPPPGYRDPTDDELSTVVADLRTAGFHIAPGATLTEIPERADADAFPDYDARYVVLPRQPQGEALPAYGPALAELFPDTPIVVMYGGWIEYHGPYAEEFAEVTAVSFYAQFSSVLSRDDFPQGNVLSTYLNRVADVRYAGLFDRPLPYQPFDPLRVAVPALPWVFAACVLGFLLLSMRPRRPGLALRRASSGVTAELTGLSALAVDLSLLTDRGSDPALARGVAQLQAARTALADRLPHRHVRRLLANAHSELDDAARRVGLDFLRPRHYLREWLA